MRLALSALGLKLDVLFSHQSDVMPLRVGRDGYEAQRRVCFGIGGIDHLVEQQRHAHELPASTRLELVLPWYNEPDRLPALKFCTLMFAPCSLCIVPALRPDMVVSVG